MGILKKLFKGTVAVSAVGTGLLLYDVQRKRVYTDQKFSDALRHYLTVNSLAFIGYVFQRKLETATKNVAKVQEEFLLKQLQENADTEYGKLYNFAAIKTAEDFIRAHPLTRYPHYKPYVDRMMSGEKMVLTKDTPVVFAVTSGTSGTASIIPMVKKQREVFFLEGISVLYRCMVDAFPDSSYLNKDFKIFYNPVWRMSESGIKVGPNSATPSESKGLLHIYSTPEPAFEILSEPEALYVHLLFALRDRHIGMIEANFASLVFNAFKTLEHRVSDLVADIRNGTLNPNLALPADVRARLEALLSPDPDRAAEIQRAMEGGIEGAGKRLWPDLHVVLCTDTGTFTLYGQKLRDTFLKDVPLYSPIYGASEGLLGINIWPTSLPSMYLLHPCAQFFELIPVAHSEEDQPETLRLGQARLGEMYEVVITNPSCVYRYRFGDVVKVVGFHHECPIIEFMYRQGQFLNVRGEKTSESVFYDCLTSTVENWDSVRLVDYCCAESIVVEDTDAKKYKSRLPCYHIFLEVEGAEGAMSVSNAQKKMLDDALGTKSYPYSSFRQKGSIGEMQVHIVQPGTFRQLRDFMIQNTPASSNQYKVPRVLKRKEAVQFMFEKVV
ncbi:GH3 domain-containing protein-like [Babylonia areolata]|uniref:GH3 domain-containing protein-like n=1 Tax=Babylonia areolata TaxID=304850 RepID=UPI003FD11023